MLFFWNQIVETTALIKNHILIIFGLLTFIFLICFSACLIWKKIKQYKQKKKFNKEYQKLDFGNDKKLFIELKDHVSPEKVMINLGLVKFGFKINVHSNNVVWAVLIELSTRIIFNKFDNNEGKEKDALDSIHNCFVSIREELKKEKLDAPTLHLMLSLLNKQMRPFLAKWHGKIDENPNENMKEVFRKELFEFKEKMLNCQETKLIFLILGIKIETFKKTLKT